MMSWCQLEAHTKLHGRTLHETLFAQPEARLPEAFDRGCTHLAVVANLDVVCVVAQRQPFTRIAPSIRVDTGAPAASAVGGGKAVAA